MNLKAKFYLVLCENGKMQVSAAVRIAFLACSGIDYICFCCFLFVSYLIFGEWAKYSRIASKIKRILHTCLLQSQIASMFLIYCLH